MYPTPDRLSDAAYYAVNEIVLKAMFWSGVLVPPGLAQRVTADLVALVEGDFTRQRETALTGRESDRLRPDTDPAPMVSDTHKEPCA